MVEAIDPVGERLRYFHGPGLYELSDEDYRGVFRLGRAFSEDVLPPYTELVRFDAGPGLHGDELRAAARDAACAAISRTARRPIPSSRFAAQLERDLPRLLEGDASDYHAYAFATVRMAGSAFEVACAQAEWLLGDRARRRARRARANRRGLQDALVQARPPPSVRARAGARPRWPTAWDEAMGQLDAALA